MRHLLTAFALLALATPTFGASPNDWLTLDADETSAKTYDWNGGSGTLQTSGSFAGSPVVTIEFKSHNTFDFEDLGCSLSGPGLCNFSTGNGEIQIVVTGGTGTDIVAAFIGGANQASTFGTASSPGVSAVDLDWDRDDIPNVSNGFDGLDKVSFDIDDDGSPDLHIGLTGTNFPFIGRSELLNRIEFETGGEINLLGGGFVGIGTSGPMTLLHLDSVGSTFITIESTGATAGIMMDTTGNNHTVIALDAADNVVFRNTEGTHDGDMFFDYENNARFRHGTEDVFTVDASGNVGIGTTSPASRLHVSGGNARIEQTVNGTTINMRLVQPDQSWSIQNNGSTDAFEIRDVTGTTTPFSIAAGVTGSMLMVTAVGVNAAGCVTYGKLSTAPAGSACDKYYDTDLNKWCFHNGGGFVQFDDGTACA